MKTITEKLMKIALVLLMILSGFGVAKTIHAASPGEKITITNTFTAGNATAGPNWKSTEEFTVPETATSITIEFDPSKADIKPAEGRYLSYVMLTPVAQTTEGTTIQFVDPKDKVTLKISEDTIFTYLFSKANVVYTYDDTNGHPLDFDWETFRPDSVYLNPGETVPIPGKATTEKTEKDGVAGIWEFSWTSDGPNVMPNPGITITVTGKWEFKEGFYKVDYVFDDPKPTTYTPALPTNESFHKGVEVTLWNDPNYDPQFSTTEEYYDGKHGSWVWLGWTKAFKESGTATPITNDDSGFSKITMPSENVVVHGSWFFREDDLEFKYTAGTGQTYYKGSGENLSGFVVERIGGDDSQTYNLFERLEVELGGGISKVLEAGTDYEYSPGSLKHDLKATFLESLEPGTYTITAYFPLVGGTAPTTFEVKRKTSPTPSKPVIPKTGIDN